MFYVKTSRHACTIRYPPGHSITSPLLKVSAWMRVQGHSSEARTNAVRLAVVVAEARVLCMRHIEGHHPPTRASHCQQSVLERS